MRIFRFRLQNYYIKLLKVVSIYIFFVFFKNNNFLYLVPKVCNRFPFLARKVTTFFAIIQEKGLNS